MPDNSSNRRPDYHRAPTTLYDLLDRVLSRQSQFEAQIAAFQPEITGVNAALAKLQAGVSAILTGVAVPERAVRLALEIPTTTIRGKPMANFELKNDAVTTFTIKATDSGGGSEPLPAGDVFTIANSDPTNLNAVMGTDAAGNPALVVNALHPLATGITVTITDSAGLQGVSQIFDIVADTAPTNLVLDVADATSVPQAVPAA
jgi:hypothetical protein